MFSTVRITLITEGVSGTEEDPPTCKETKFFSYPYPLGTKTMPISNNLQLNGASKGTTYQTLTIRIKVNFEM